MAYTDKDFLKIFQKKYEKNGHYFVALTQNS